MPLTAVTVVTTVVTEKCIIDITGEGFKVVAMYPGTTKEEIAGAIDADVTFADDIWQMAE